MNKKHYLTILLFLLLSLTSNATTDNINNNTPWPNIKSETIEVTLSPETKTLDVQVITDTVIYSVEYVPIFFNDQNIKNLKIIDGSKEISVDDFTYKLGIGTHKLTLKYQIPYTNTSNTFNGGNNIISDNLIRLWNYTQWQPSTGISQTIDYKIIITFPQNLKLLPVFEGDLINKIVDQNKTTYIYIAKNIRKGINLFAADYVCNKHNSNGIAYYCYTLKDNVKYSNVAINYAKKIITFISQNYYKYPYKKYTIVEAPDWSKNNGRGENSLCILDTSVFPNINLLIRRNYFLAHEISHTYWNSIVAPDLGFKNKEIIYFDIYFFTEVLATYTAIDYAMTYDKFNFDMSFIRVVRDYYINKTDPDEVIKYINLSRNDSNKINKMIFTSRPTLMHYYLAKLIGREKYRKALHDLIDRYKYKTVTFEDFRNILYKYYPNKDRLNKFINLWLDDSSELVPRGVEDFFPVSYQLEKNNK